MVTALLVLEMLSQSMKPILSHPLLESGVIDQIRGSSPDGGFVRKERGQWVEVGMQGQATSQFVDIATPVTCCELEGFLNQHLFGL